MIRLQRLNVVRIVDSEEKAQVLERQGFVRVKEPEEKPAPEPKGKKAGGGD